MKPPPSPVLAALGLAVAAHAAVVVGWTQLVRVGPSQTAKALATPQTVSWRWRQVSTPPRPAAPQVVAKRPGSAHVDPNQALPRPSAGTHADMDDTGVSAAAPGEQPTHFWPASALDFRALPLQAPDPAPLQEIAWTAEHPMRLQLSITARGEVVDVAPLDAVPPPAEVLAALGVMFKATPFMPARRQGQDVASLQHIEIAP